MVTFHNDDSGFILMASPGGLVLIVWVLAIALLLMYFVGLTVGRSSSRPTARDRSPGPS